MSSGLIATLTILAALAGSSIASAVDANTQQEPPGVRPGSDPSNPIDVILPPGLQATYFRSLPIAGLLVTPDDIAQLMQTNPRLRATASQPSSGKGAAYPIPESSVVSTRADPVD
jgi:hypothetical protein